MKYITNPILPGFNPDPSIVRVGDDYYVATSTFEWFPGVQIHHSKDLVNWELISHPLKRLSQLDMKGNPTSGGVWAPCLTYDNGTFYLIYTDVKCHTGIFKDTHNYLVTTEDIMGEWSDPIYLNSSGFDPSLFHDEDGHKYIINMNWDFRKGKNKFAGILLQEYSVEQKKLIGEIHNIFKGTELGFTEGPHIYKKDGYYYLLTAEGGTGIGHAVTLARSKNILGPYEVHPDNPILTSKGKPELTLQKAGHADLVETQNGEWYLVHLCGRPLANGRCILGRETSIQKMEWSKDGWLRLEAGGNSPLVKVPGPSLPEHKFKEVPSRDDFDNSELDINFSSLRIPLTEEHFSLTERTGFLRLKGRESISSKHNQTMIATRQQKFDYTATTCLEFEPDSFKQMAGLICIYDVQNFYYIRVTHDEELGKCIGIMTCINNKFDEPLEQDVSIEGCHRIYLRVVVDYEKLNFYYSKDETQWIPLGETFDASTLSDEACKEGCFTGAFVGLCCQDLNGTGKVADFDYFEYV
jgi:xylan 1,4-beta-xylosidase